VSLEGYLPFARDLTLADGARETITAALVPPNTSKSHFALRIDGGLPLGAVVGGDLVAGCSGSCSASVPVGAHAQVHATYETPSGFGVGIHAGYLVLSESITGRTESLTPVGATSPLSGSANDSLNLSGLTVGADADYTAGAAWPLTLRLGVGVLVGSVSDARTATFPGQVTGTVSASQSQGAGYLYVGPEARIGRKLGDHFAIDVGVAVLVLTALSTPTWDKTQTTLATVTATQRVNEAQFPSATLTGGFMLAIVPGIGLKYEL